MSEANSMGRATVGHPGQDQTAEERANHGPAGFDRKSIGCYDLVVSLLSPASAHLQGIGRQATCPRPFPFRAWTSLYKLWGLTTLPQSALENRAFPFRRNRARDQKFHHTLFECESSVQTIAQSRTHVLLSGIQ